MKTKYLTDIYVRVSREDGDKPESDSISNQKKICMDYLKSHPELKLRKIYEDDGYSGVSFERPSFLEMYKAVQEGKVDCIVVKDLSRLGRNWLKAGDYILNKFPMYNVRFIAIGENYDSFNTTDDEDGLILPVRNLINDTYAGDISQKTRSTFEIKRKLGEFIGCQAVYGYKKSDGDKHKLVIDEQAAEVVRDIFKWKIQGLSLSRIAKQLNDYSIMSPMEYKRYNGVKYATSFKVNLKAQWNANAVSRILNNEIYLGHMIQGKRSTESYKDKNVKYLPEDKWIKVENTHEAIISREVFDTVYVKKKSLHLHQ